MGGGRWDSTTWNNYSKTTYGTADRATLRSSATASMFTAKTMAASLDPSKVKDSVTGTREARDSADNPLSTPIIVASDVTGSMGRLAQEVLTGMETVCTELYDRKPVTDPTILTGAIGDMFFDSAPLQISQFESDIRIVDSTRLLYLEGGGGGNFGESYAAVWLFAAMQTSSDAWEKRGEKGFLFTIGDEPLLGSKALAASGVGRSHAAPVAVTKDQAKRFMGLDIEADLSAEDCYDLAAQRWEIFHISVGGQRTAYAEGVKASFGAVLGDRLLWLQDTAHLPEVIVSAIQVVKGDDKDTVAASWTGGTAVAVAEALAGLPAKGSAPAGGVVAL